MRARSSMPFCPCDCRRVGLGYLSAAARYTTAQLARGLSPEALREAFDQVLGLGGLVDGTFVGQVDKEIETLQQVTGRTLAAAEMTTLRDTLYQSLSAIIAGVGLTDPSFAKVALELSKEGAAKLGIA